jgi:hypothetical protein
MRALRTTLIIIGLFQLVLGLAFLLAPATTADLFGLTPAAPPWANWLLAMMAARFLGFAYGMFVAFRDPGGWGLAWINAMIGIQAVDWIVTLGYLTTGTLSITQVTTAAVAPPLFVIALVVFHPRRRRAVPAAPALAGDA